VILIRNGYWAEVWHASGFLCTSYEVLLLIDPFDPASPGLSTAPEDCRRGLSCSPPFNHHLVARVAKAVKPARRGILCWIILLISRS